MQKNSLVILGKIGSPFGVRGWLHIHSFTEPPENILHYSPWLLLFPNHKQKTVTLLHNQHHLQKIQVQLEGCEDRTLASTYTGAEIAVPREQLPKLPAGEYYWSDLIGLTVITQQGQTLGTITEFFSTGSNDVFVVTGKKRHLLPYLLDQVVLEINLEKKIMLVDWDPDF